MPFIITDPCIETKDTACVDVCPVDCIHPRKDEPEFASTTMLYIHPEECIDCGACEPECPNNAIYEGGVEWAIADGTSVKGAFTLLDGTTVDADQKNAPLSVDTYYITPNKCTECQGFHEEPQCAAVCPVDCCVPDEMYQETVEELMAKKDKLHL